MKKPNFTFVPPKTKDQHTKNSILLYVLLVILILMMVLITVVLKATRDELRTESAIRRVESDNTLTRMIKQAVENLYKPALIEPKEQKQYVYEMHLRFPSSNEEDRILAGVGSSSNAPAEYATISSHYLMPTAGSILQGTKTDALLNSVPMFQKCSRPFLIQYKASPVEYSDEYRQVGTKPLANGKTLYVFKSTACTHKYFTDKYTQAELDRLQTQLLQAESY